MKNKFLSNCPLCKSKFLFRIKKKHSFESFTTKGLNFIFNIGASICKQCGFIFLNPRASQFGMKLYYAGQSRIPRNLDKLSKPFLSLLDMQVQYIIKHWNNRPISPKILDIGGAEGFFLNRISKEFDKTNLEMIEPSSEYVKQARKNLSKAKIKTGVIEEQKLISNSYDLITLRHVFEHLQNPKEILHIIHKALKKSALLHLEVPDSLSWPPSLTSLFHHEHLNYFSRETLSDILSKNGFKVLSCEKWNLNPKGSGFAYPVLRCIASKNGKEIKKIQPVNWKSEAKKYEQIERQRKDLIKRKLGPLKIKINKLVKNGHKIGIFGAGPHTLDFLKAIKVPVKHFSKIFDNNKNKSGKNFKGLIIKTPSKSELKDLRLIIVSSQEYEDEIYWQLKKINLPKLRILKIYGDCN